MKKQILAIVLAALLIASVIPMVVVSAAGDRDLLRKLEQNRINGQDQ